MIDMHKSKERDRAASPGPTFMSPQQMSSYFQDLRTNRPTRPSGSRPPPAHFNTWSSRTNSRATADSRVTSPVSPITTQPTTEEPEALPESVPEQPKLHKRTTSNMSIDEILAGTAGRALVQPPRGRPQSTATPDAERERTPSVQYRESGRRQVEREEARQLRLALEEFDLKKEQGLYDAARDEAAELVYDHQNPDARAANPDAPYHYPGPGGKGSHNRSRSQGRSEREQDLQRTNSKLRKRHSVGSSAGGSRSSSLHSHRAVSNTSVTADVVFGDSPTKETMDIDQAIQASRPRQSSIGRRKASGSVFKNPDDQIYEEPEEETQPPVQAVPQPQVPSKTPFQARRNPFSRVRIARENSLMRANTDPTVGMKRFDRFEIQNNPPTQSRNAGYTANPILPPKAVEEVKPDSENNEEVKMKDGKEIRSDDIRAATGFRLKDRSAKLPTPTMVSDSPGRPIVSFQENWKPKEVELKEEKSILPQSTPKPVAEAVSGPRRLAKAATDPVIPTIQSTRDSLRKTNGPPAAGIPQINVTPQPAAPSTRVNRANVPTISVYEDPPSRPLPTPAASRKVNTPPSVAPPVPTINVSQAPPARSKPSPAPPIPTISVQETPQISVTPSGRGASVKAPSISVTPIPSISVSDSPSPPVPTINVDGGNNSTRPLPNPRNYSAKPFPRNNGTNNRSHWTPTNVRTGALCNQCALPISGRIVSAGGVRFHPECFLCHHCGEHLECVAFYPEPDNKRAERIARIHARLRGEDIEFLPSHPTLEDMMHLEREDGDEGFRFFCHLDFHELFSPRCKSCKTPIEGEVVVACGAEWHVGHFFCAQCGDPFDSTTPFVEKDGYAWCVGCHTNRYSTKCRKCRKPVVDTVVKALGSEWHVGCFCCVECSGPFEDGRYFLRGESEDPVCVRCEERRLKA
ncbi:hypothetical protein BU24DRAFT_364119 [Aaosphaeria arxii CBS 175.79]|uniref:LIM zinc-binding domain-containing protein n=1 Tax=Aaosphaeria arxii CBS 175.79 TaxID=1450172 RepID=A0A6A5Y1M9_9PLEO|nr:uncharacterized protein BU24DRAFT_364119 [Aaosphaeria arxii CBS 175.79]KAF2018831.1 hypothetical protein BU24DRAFT_364119 [Aaosphaeria arxii CBS 175.79]